MTGDPVMARPRRGRSAGFSLVEVVIAFAILVVLALTILSALLPLQTATAESNVSLDLDRNARRVLSQLRREVRQSGQANGTEKLTVPADGATITTPIPPAAAATTTLLTYSMRTGRDVNADWSAPITIQAVPDGTYSNVPANSVNRYRLERVQNGETVVIARNVSQVNVSRPAGGRTVIISVDFTRPDPHRVDPSTVPAPITQRHTDQIEFLNQ